jgi:DUF4097 and DUF4098 domain-containing protein YvlB
LENVMRTLALAFLALPLAVAAAQSTSTPTTRARRFMDNCQRNSWGDDERFCETRDVEMPASPSLRVDGQDNGGVTVHGWDKSTIQVVAMIQTNAESEADARDLAKRVRISANSGEVRADGPDTRRHESWSVSYEIWVPSHTGLDLRARNGGIAVDGVVSRMELETVNGGLVLSDVGGDVHGTTSNGGVSAELSGSKWNGTGLDLQTSNGGVHLYIPDNYSARLETGTVNGGMNIGFPITVQGSLGRRLSTQLGSGGPTIRAVTTNGGVTIRRR